MSSGVQTEIKQNVPGDNIILKTFSTQHLGFGNIAYDTKGLSQDQMSCAAACSRPLPKTQDQIVECLRTCGVTSIWEQDESKPIEAKQNGIKPPVAAMGMSMPKLSRDQKIMLVGGLGLLALMVLVKRRG